MDSSEKPSHTGDPPHPPAGETRAPAAIVADSRSRWDVFRTEQESAAFVGSWCVWLFPLVRCDI